MPIHELKIGSTKRQLLSIVAADLPMQLLKSEFPGLTNWKIKTARSQAFFQGRMELKRSSWHIQEGKCFFCAGRGTIPDTERSPMKRYTDDQLAHFIAFIQSPHITTDIPFGERNLKLSSGEKITVPDVIRNIIPSRIGCSIPRLL